MSLEALIRDLLAADPARPGDVPAWWAVHAGIPGEVPFDRAARAAARFDRLGWAFASGYHEALRALVPGLGDQPAALAVTEARGNHPRAIEAALEADGDGWRLTGTKTFVTLGTRARQLLVLAWLPDHRDLALVAVPAARAGVSLRPRPPAPFVPEIPHAVLALDRVRVEPDERLSGDGWAHWVRPFRTVEDLHVHGAALAWLLGVGRRADWPEPVIERLLLAITACRSLALADPAEPSVHVALGGLVRETGAAIDAVEPLWSRVDAEVSRAFARDRVLLGVAAEARHKRLERAWERFGRA